MASDSTGTPPPSGSRPPERPEGSHRFFDWMRSLGIVRRPGWIGGVCAGVAARLGIDAIIVRGIVVVFALFGGPMLLLYAAAWLLLPDEEDRIHLERLVHGEFTPPVIGVGVLFLFALLPVGPALWFGRGWWDGANWFGLGHALWVLAVIAAIVWFVVWAARRSRSIDARPGSFGRPEGSAFAMGPASAGPAPTGPAPAGPASPPPPAAPDLTDPDALAAWKEQQANWKREYDAWRAAEAQSERALARDRAAEQRRIRQEQNAARQREWAARNARTRSNPLYSLIAIGLALVAGAVVTLILSAGGEWTPRYAMAGASVTLGTLGLAVVINGLLGKRSGGAGGVAILAIIVLVVGSLFSWTDGSATVNRSVDWAPAFSTTNTVAERTVVGGSVRVDLTHYFDDDGQTAGSQSGRVRIRAVGGPVHIVLPADAVSRVSARVVGGSITLAGQPSSGAITSEEMSFEPTTPQLAHHQVSVEVWAVGGDISAVQAGERQASIPQDTKEPAS